MAIRKLLSGAEVEWEQKTGQEKTVTYGQIVEAINASIYKQGFGHLLCDDEKGSIVDACALGQCALNLGVSMDSLEDFLERDDGFEFGEGTLWDDIIELNDTEHRTLKQIARKIKAYWKDQLTREVKLEVYNYAEFSNWKGIIVGK